MGSPAPREWDGRGEDDRPGSEHRRGGPPGIGEEGSARSAQSARSAPTPEGPSVPLRDDPLARHLLPDYMRPEGVSGKAVFSLTLSIIGLFVIPVIISAIAILIGWGALADIGRRPALGGKGLAVSGVLIGVIGLVIGLVAVIIAASYSWLVVYLF